MRRSSAGALLLLAWAACSPPASAPATVRADAPPAMAASIAAPKQALALTAEAAPSKAAPACPADMVDVAVACIDRYEAPNAAGEKPIVMATADEGEAWCGARGKRLCTEDEWLRACRGPEGLRYPYGARYDEHACNHDKPYRAPRWSTLSRWPAEEAKAEAARLDQAEPGGARERCGSAEGVHDLTGNVAEWVIRKHPHPEACSTPEQKQHRHVAQGCSWTKCFRAPHEPACDYVNCAHPGAFRSYEIGFRCCKDRSR